MERSIDIYKQYLECLKKNDDFFCSFYFRPNLNFDFVKYSDILQNGLNTRNVPLNYEKDNLYVTYYRNKDLYLDLFDKITYALAYPSFLISSFIDSYDDKTSYPYCNDVRYMMLPIDKSDIKGVTIPEHLVNKNVLELESIIDKNILISLNKLNDYIKYVNKYFDIQNNSFNCEDEFLKFKGIYDHYYMLGYEKNASIEKALLEQKEYYNKNIYELVSNYIYELWSKKLNNDDVKLIDIIKYINNDNKPIYEIKKEKILTIN